MTTTAAAYSVRQTSNKGEIADFLNRDRIYAGYALCDLDEEYFGACRWFLVSDTQGEPSGLAMEFGQLSPVVLFLMGETEAACAPLHSALTPAFIQLTAQPEHLTTLR